MGHTQDSSHLLGLYLALTSINLGECGGVAGKAQVGDGIRNIVLILLLVHRPMEFIL